MAIIVAMGVAAAIGAAATAYSANKAADSKDAETQAMKETKLLEITKTYDAAKLTAETALATAQLKADTDIRMQAKDLEFQKWSKGEEFDIKREELALQKEKLTADTDLANRKLDTEFKLEWESLRQRDVEEENKHEESMASINKNQDGEWAWFYG